MSININLIQSEIHNALAFSEQGHISKALTILRKIDSSNINFIQYKKFIRHKILTLIAIQYLKTNDYKSALSELAKCQASDNELLPNEVVLRWSSCKYQEMSRVVERDVSKFKHVHVYQIAYNTETLIKIYDNINILDNSDNVRSDWREYWPIRNFFFQNQISDNEFYCFLSPKFKDKTGISEEEFYGFINENTHSYDMIDFSPFYDQKVLYKNPFEQGDFHHPGLIQIIKQYISLNKNMKYDCNNYKNTSNFIFFNYFLEKGWVWKKWFQICESFFKEAEENQTELGRLLNALTSYGSEKLPMKVFIIERVISILIENNKIKIAHYPAINNGLSDFFAVNNFQKLIMLDVDRDIYIRNKFHAHIERYEDGRTQLIKEFQNLDHSLKKISY